MLSFPPPNEIRSSTCYLTDVAPALFLVGGGHCFLVGGVDVSVLLTPSAWLIASHSKFYFLLPRPSTCKNSYLFISQSTQFPFSLLSSTRSLIATFRPASLDSVSCNFFVYFCMFHPSPSIYQVHCPNMKLAKKSKSKKPFDFLDF